MNVKVTVNDAAVLHAFNSMGKQMPYVMATAVTELANHARTEVVNRLPSHFIIRNRFTAMGIRTKRGEKNDYPNTFAMVGSTDKYMVEHEEGGPRKKGNKAFSFPYRIRRNIRTIVKRGKWPGPLLGGGKISKRPTGRPKGSRNGQRRAPTPFILKLGRFTGVFIRTSGLAASKYKYRGGKRQRFKTLWRLYSPTIRIKKEEWLYPHVERVVQDRHRDAIVNAMYKAMSKP